MCSFYYASSHASRAQLKMLHCNKIVGLVSVWSCALNVAVCYYNSPPYVLVLLGLQGTIKESTTPPIAKPGNLGKTSILVRTSMTQTHGRP